MKIQRHHLLIVAGVVFGLALAGVLTVLGAYLYVRPSLPEVDVLKQVQLQEPMRIYSQDGSLMATFGEQKRLPLAWEDVPQLVVNAFLAAEDDRFFSHPGVDYQGLIRAGINHLLTGDRSQGGGTITMQLAREFFLTREKTYIRKIREIFLAFRIERELNKQEILTLYLNKIFLGNRAYGVAAAAQVYYGAGIDGLSPAQAAALAATAQRPSSNNPASNTPRLLERRNYVLGRMHALGWLADDAYRAALAEPNLGRVHAAASEVEATYVAEMVRAEMLRRYGLDAYNLGLEVHTTIDAELQHAANRALRMALHEYDFRHGYRGPVRRVEFDPETDEETEWNRILDGIRSPGLLHPGLVVETGDVTASVYTGSGQFVNLDWEALSWARRVLEDGRLDAPPREAADVVEPGDVVYLVRREGAWHLAQMPAVQGALVSLDAFDGGILALSGGYDFHGSQYNRATQALRQPGSAFKPFIYATALARGFTAATVVNDAPVVFEEDEALERDWRPRNDSGRFYGPTRLREALAKSRNLVSVRVLRSIGTDFTVRYLSERFGFDYHRLPKDLSLSLGTGGLTPLELTRGYAVFANGGHRVEPWLIERIKDADGVVIWEADPAVVCQGCEHAEAVEPGIEIVDFEAGDEALELELEKPPRLAERTLDPQDAFLIDDMLREVVRSGTGRAARTLGRSDLAGKTGSTNEHHDAWFAGYGGGIATSAWVGFDQARPLGPQEYGGRAALPMWIDYMRVALDGVPEIEQLQPPGIVTARIDPESGMLAQTGQRDAVFEYFREENLARLEAETRAAMQREGDDEDREDNVLF